MGLKEYNNKRNFSSTSEPKGKIKKSKSKRFVIQYHEARANHYDFRLEHKGVLISFAVPKGLSLNPKVKRLAVKVEDHPLDYIFFEGIIPKGNYGAGTVEIYDKGNYEINEDMDEALEKGFIKIELIGEKIKGFFSLVKTNDKNWLIIKNKDEHSMAKTKKETSKLPFKKFNVQLATLSKDLPKGKGWIYEIKYDGYRMIVIKENKKVKILSRNNIDYTSKFKKICESIKSIDDNFIIDGEIVSFDENGRSDFKLLQENLKNKNNEFYYVIFDLLAINNNDLRTLPLIKRKEKLKRLLYECESNLIYSKHVDKGLESFKFAKENNLEGIIAKKKDAPYIEKRSSDWLKIKCYLRQEFIIVGFITTEKNKMLSALVLGYYDSNKQLKYVGKVGTGFNEKQRSELNERFNKIRRKTSPLKEEVNLKNINWLTPKYVCEIKFAEFTKDKLLRQPSFISLRNDKNPKEVILEFNNEKH